MIAEREIPEGQLQRAQELGHVQLRPEPDSYVTMAVCDGCGAALYWDPGAGVWAGWVLQFTCTRVRDMMDGDHDER